MSNFSKAHPYWGLLYMRHEDMSAVRKIMQDGAYPHAVEGHLRSLAGESFYDLQFAALRDRHPERLARLIDERQSPIDITKERRMGALMADLAPKPQRRTAKPIAAGT